MFRSPPKNYGKLYQLGIIGLLMLSAVALAITIWVELDFLREQKIVEELIRKLPSDSTASAKELAGALRWQFRLTTLVLVNLVVTGFAVMLLWRAYQLSQESLRDFKALAADILSSIDQAVITIDVQGNVTSINRCGLELLNIKTECVGRPLKELSAVPLHDFCTEWKVEKSPTMFRDYKANVNGSQRALRAFCQTLSDYAGNDLGMVLQLRDVTKRVLIEERMRRMERYMGLGSLAAGLHHEIKNPLTALSLHVQLLEEQIAEDNPSEDVRQMLNVIKTEMARVGGVLEGFRDLASSGQLNLAPVDLMNLIQRQVELATPQAEQQNIQIQTVIKCDLSKEIPADRIRLEQVLLNLILNAMEAMPEGGTLTVTVTEVDGNVQVEVADTGKGIPEDLHDKVFDPYFTTKNEGTGLGLALCDKIMNQHQGNLSFHSSERGTQFQLTLPR
ncbi:two-component system sensor histidine kinase NtrB [Thalassoglobus polymorphus]|uniref:histidine kinase n=1 Tax=Thalassoglobus polymorphus TaxID=2527994 RepID=A0A517QQK2_9PLAN|nr:ATP-binding protein [Thalassoglobus polymorphus]QDT33875.1 Sensor protein ZraS [Thalassoglobus polymorphus]